MNQTILVVEDDDTSYMYFEEVLKRKGLNPVRAENGTEAVEMVQDNPDIVMVLMDIKMPSMNGHDATRQIKKLRPDLPVLIQTAYASIIDRQKAFNAGCDDFITKPVNKDILIEKIAKFLF
jgi:CheY-like chemotaxis protein